MSGPKDRLGQAQAGGYVHPHKRRTGMLRLWHAARYSLQGLYAAWWEKAFRQEVMLASVLVPTALWFGSGWVEAAVLCVTVVLVLVAELLNSAVEAAIDRVGLQWHPLAKKAKDLGSAGVFLALLLCAAVWAAAVWDWVR